MYQCNHCGELIEQPEERHEVEWHEVRGAREPYETVLYFCPYCGSDDIEDRSAEEDDCEDAEESPVEAR